MRHISALVLLLVLEEEKGLDRVVINYNIMIILKSHTKCYGNNRVRSHSFCLGIGLGREIVLAMDWEDHQ